MRTGKNGIRRITAMVCALALCASMLPTAVFAEPETTATPMETPNVTNSEESVEDDEITIDDLVEPSQEPAGDESDGDKDANTELESDATPAPSESPAPSATPVPSENPASGEETTEATESESVPDEQLTETPSMDSFSAQNTVSANVETLNNEEVTVIEAVDGTAENFYVDSGKMIWLSVSGGTDIATKQNVTFILNIDGQKEAEIEVRGVYRSQAQLKINASAYDYTARRQGDNKLQECTWNDLDDSYHISNNSYSDLTGDKDAYTIVIDLTTPTLKDKDAIRIENKEDSSYYGTFFWAKGTATTSDYERPLEVYVNGNLTYKTTVKTPQLLTAGSASYWFEANLEKYTSNVTLDPSGSLDNVTQKTLKVYLTTKCACGNDNCQCSGGCECQPGCYCLQCKPEQGENEIITPYGTISYNPNGIAVKRSLQVEIYVNGQKEYETSEALTVSSAIDGGFAFDDNETKGYYFHSQAKSLNSYDILVRDNADDEWEYVNNVSTDGSSWTPGTGNIKLIYDKDYMVRIYLYTFDRYMTLDVTRRYGTDDYVGGYTISYIARDPETGEEKRYTYPATSFAAGQPQIIPYGREVTLTADCLPNYEATRWRADRGSMDLEFTGDQGNNGSDLSPLYAYGNTVWFTEYGTSDDQLQLYIEGVKEIVPPTDDEMQQLLGNAAVKVDCTTKDEHSDATYALKAGSYDKAEQLGGNSVDNYTYTITVKPDAYVTEYKTSTGEHSNATPATQNIVLEYVAGEWTVQTATPVVFSVTCEDDTPTAPRAPTLKDIGKQVKVVCVGAGASTHSGKDYTLQGEEGTDYIIGEVTDNNGTYVCEITVKTASLYVNMYNTAVGTTHTLYDCEEEQSFIMQYVNDAWELKEPAPGQDGYKTPTGVLYTVSCNTITVTPANLVIYKGGEKEDGADSNVEIVNGETGKVLSNDGSLPEIGFYLQLSDDLNEQLRKLLGKNANDVLNLSEYITLSAKDSSGNSYSWELQKYGDTDNSASGDSNNYFIYKIVPAQDSNGVPLKVTFWDPVEKKYVGTDDFNVDSSLSKDYEMEIYGDRVDASTLTAEINIPEQQPIEATVAASGKPATLTVRYVNGDQIDVVTHSYDSIEAASEADDLNQKALHTAYMIREDSNKFVINESNVQVDGEDVSLLFDDIVDSTSYEYEKTLTSKAVAAAITADGSLNGVTLKTEAKYLDLVESGNGNAWVTAQDVNGDPQAVKVYWPYPEGTNKYTKFYLAHFEDLDRDTSTAAMAKKLSSAKATGMSIQKDDYGISFTTTDFSPYVLVWEESQGQVTPPDNGDGNNNTTTNNNTQNTTVNVAANNSAAAPAAAAVAIPQTGDNSQPLVWIALVGISGAALAALAVFRRKRSDK